MYTPSTKLGDHGKSLIVKFYGEDAVYHPTWLRHNCQCPSCLASSGQKTINFSEINLSNTLKSVKLSGTGNSYLCIQMPLLIVCNYVNTQ